MKYVISESRMEAIITKYIQKLFGRYVDNLKDMDGYDHDLIVKKFNLNPKEVIGGFVKGDYILAVLTADGWMVVSDDVLTSYLKLFNLPRQLGSIYIIDTLNELYPDLIIRSIGKGTPLSRQGLYY